MGVMIKNIGINNIACLGLNLSVDTSRIPGITHYSQIAKILDREGLFVGIPYD